MNSRVRVYLKLSKLTTSYSEAETNIKVKKLVLKKSVSTSDLKMKEPLWKMGSTQGLMQSSLPNWSTEQSIVKIQMHFKKQLNTLKTSHCK